MPSDFHSHKAKKLKLDDKWWIPDEIVTFVTHLPKSMEGTPVKSLHWIYKSVFATWSRGMSYRHSLIDCAHGF